MKKVIKWIMGVLVVLVAGAYGYYESIKPVRVDFFETARGEVVKTFKEEGTVTAVEERDVYAILPNKIISLKVKEGQEITKGQKIASLDLEQLQDQIRILEVQKSNTETLLEKTLKDIQDQIQQQSLMIEETSRQLEVATKDLNKAQTLFSQDSAPQNQVDAMQNQVNQLENVLRQQQLALSQLEAQASPDSETVKYYSTSILTIDNQITQLAHQLKEGEIIAPVDGIVVNVNYDKGSPVNPAVPICTIFNPEEYRVEVYILAEDIVKVYEGMEVAVIQELEETDRVLKGKIESIAPSAVEKISSLGLNEKRVKLKIVLDETEQVHLYPGYSLDVEFTTYREDNLITAPKTSVFQTEGKDAVWLVKEDRVQLTYVRKGIENDVDVVITEGLAEGDIIVKNPNTDGLKDGISVTNQEGFVLPTMKSLDK